MMDEYLSWLRNDFLPFKGKILENFEGIKITESIANLGGDGGPSLRVDLLGDAEVQKWLEEMEKSLLQLD